MSETIVELSEQLRLNACRYAHETEDQFKQRRIRVELVAADTIERLARERDRISGELDVANNNHRAMAHQLAEMGARLIHAESSLSDLQMIASNEGNADQQAACRALEIIHDASTIRARAAV